eukprot:7431258-Pyramimonas_sp.AAC.1
MERLGVHPERLQVQGRSRGGLQVQGRPSGSVSRPGAAFRSRAAFRVRALSKTRLGHQGPLQDTPPGTSRALLDWCGTLLGTARLRGELQ